jgi:hypothetical protein
MGAGNNIAKAICVNTDKSIVSTLLTHRERIQMAEQKKLIVRVKAVYGNELVYPVNTEAKLFATISGKKTLDSVTLAAAVQLGFVIEIEPQTI